MPDVTATAGARARERARHDELGVAIATRPTTNSPANGSERIARHHPCRLRAAGFDKGLSVLLWMAMVFCTRREFIKDEQPFATVLNHWDEMMGYATVLAPLGVFDHSLPA
jgi:hypothetical protein